MRVVRAFRLIVLAAVFAAGCSTSPADTAAPAASGADTSDAAASAKRVHGRAPVVNGTPPIIVLEPRGGARTFPAPTEIASLDQVQLTFLPALLFVRAGYQAEFWNSDEVLHNVRVMNKLTKEGVFNVAVPTNDVYRYTFKEPGLYDVTCDVHPAMLSALVVSTTPYAMQADATGAFSFDDVAPGAYVATAYVGGMPMEKDIEVSTGPVEVVFQP